MSEDHELEILKMKMLERIIQKREDPLYVKIAAGEPIEGNEEIINRATKMVDVVLLDFWAEWCGPCRMMEPAIHRAAMKYKGKVAVVKINVDKERELAMKFRIMAVPTYMLVVNGKIAEKVTGAVGYDVLDRIIQKYIR